jgi:16S rRNA C967 or C1407 C5-methylase (RsmB/RsmF family)
MGKTHRNLASAAEDSFHKHYASIWGRKRWENSLYPALAEPTRYAALVNRYAPISDFWQSIDSAQIPREELQQLQFPVVTDNRRLAVGGILCFSRGTTQVWQDGKLSTTPSALPFPQPRPSESHPAHLFTHWNLDAASALAAHLLDIKPGEAVLDLCAAPGGKSVSLAQKMWPAWHADDSDLHHAVLGSAMAPLSSNEADARRQKRLSDNLRAYLPPHLVNEGLVQCSSMNGTSTSAKFLAGYDKVLVDAPCSSERHIIHAHLKAKASGNAAPEMTNWRPGSSKRLAATQVQLLMTALKAAKVGGKVMYATCSIETTENDGVLEKMLKEVEKESKKGLVKWKVEVGFGAGEEGQRMEAQLLKWVEKTKYGWIVLPDHPDGGRWGPLFFALITKVAG